MVFYNDAAHSVFATIGWIQNWNQRNSSIFPTLFVLSQFTIICKYMRETGMLTRILWRHQETVFGLSYHKVFPCQSLKSSIIMTQILVTGTKCIIKACDTWKPNLNIYYMAKKQLIHNQYSMFTLCLFKVLFTRMQSCVTRMSKNKSIKTCCMYMFEPRHEKSFRPGPT